MQERHTDRKQYFEEQVLVTEKFVIPYIEQVIKLKESSVVTEIGCGEGGNLKPFLDRGCKAIGIDLALNKIENGEKYYASHLLKKNLQLIVANIYDIDAKKIEKSDLIILRDTIEHIPNQSVFMNKLKDFLKPDGKVFFAFPPWRMPFGGHQQICDSKILNKTPFTHLLPMNMYKLLLKKAGETDNKIQSLQEIKETGISTAHFKCILKKNSYKIEKEDYFLINPNYEIKFNLKTRKLPFLLNIPYIRDFFTTAYYCIVTL